MKSRIALMSILLSPLFADAATIEKEIHVRLAPISGVFGEWQHMGDIAAFFHDDPITLHLGDTVIVTLLFDQRLEVTDVGDPSWEVFTFGMDCSSLCPPPNGYFAGDWTSSIEALGAQGDIWPGTITMSWRGGGAGFGWGGQGIQVTNSVGSFTGVRWTTTITQVREGDPLLLAAFTGFSGGADGLRLLPLEQQIDIDIRPGSEINKVILGANRLIPVAVLTTSEFDATQIDVSSVKFGIGEATELHERGHIEDVDFDGDMDMLLHFELTDTSILCGDSSVTLLAETFNGMALVGTDAIAVHHCE